MPGDKAPLDPAIKEVYQGVITGLIAGAADTEMELDEAVIDWSFIVLFGDDDEPIIDTQERKTTAFTTKATYRRRMVLEE